MRDNARPKILSLTPDVCKAPIGSTKVPIPYTITAKQADDANTCPTVRATGKRVHTMGSLITTCSGNEPGTGGGVSSGVNVGWCRPQSNKSSFLVDGHQVLQDNCVYEMNCAGPNGPSNTLGKLNYDDA